MKKKFQQGYVISVYLFLYAPILVLILYSFNQTRFSLTWHGFSLQWYKELFHDRELWLAFFHSCLLGVTASGVATLSGLLACVHMFLNQRAQHQKLFMVLMILIVIPDLVLGVSLLVFFDFMRIRLGFLSLFIAHITFCIPFVIMTIHSRIHTLDVNLYYSAVDLGASRRVALTKILLPLLWPSVLSAFLLCFTLSFDDVVISYFVAGPEFNILSLTIYSLVKTGVSPELNALCSITILMSMTLVIIAYFTSRK